MTDKSVGKMERAAAMVRWIAVISYPAATGLGLFYAHSFYSAFDIEFLNFVSPLDFLFISLAKADKLLPIVFFLPISSALVAIMTIVAIIAVAITFRILLTLIGILMRAAICFASFLWSILVTALIISTVLLILSPVVTIFAGHAAMARIRRAVAALRHNGVPPSGTDVLFHSYWDLLWSPMDIVKSSWSSTTRAASEVGIKRGFKEVTDKIVDIVKDACKFLCSLFSHKWTLRATMVFFVIAFTVVACRSGVVDAECMIENDQEDCGNLTTTGGISGVIEYSRAYGKGLLSKVSSSASSTSKVFIVPTANVAAIEFLPRQIEGSARKQVSLTIRQDASTDRLTNLPKCLTYVGATETAQFLVDFTDDDAELAQREECRSDQPLDSGDGCDLVAQIGPFASGQATMSGMTEPDEKPCDRTVLTDVSGLIQEINAQREGGQVVERMFLIGRADSRLIYNSRFRSNSGLAQARAEWVWHQLLSASRQWAEAIHVVRLTAGPVSHGDLADACDRSVEVHICWEQAESGDTLLHLPAEHAMETKAL